MLLKLGRLFRRIVVGALVAVIVIFMPPLPGFPRWLSKVQMPVAVFLFVCYVGVLLYDTLFYDHYLP